MLRFGKKKRSRSESSPQSEPPSAVGSPCRLCGQDPFTFDSHGIHASRNSGSRSVPTTPTSYNGVILKRDVDHLGNGLRGPSSPSNGGEPQRGLLVFSPHKLRLEQPGNIQPSFMYAEQLTRRRSSFPVRKKSDATRIPALKPGAKKPVSKSPSLPKKINISPDGTLGKPRPGRDTLQVPDDLAQQISKSLEELEKDEDSGTKENGSGSSDIQDEVDGFAEGQLPEDSARARAAIEHLSDKIQRTMEQIKEEQATKEANVNEYLRLAGEADKVQLLRIKQVFEKKNQKSTANLSQLQRKLENQHKKLRDIETHGVQKHAKEVLKDMGQGIKGVGANIVGVGANIVDGITEFSGGVVGNIKGAKETIVSKPREFAHLIKNKFGSADNISSLKASEDSHTDELEKPHGGGTLPAREVNQSRAEDTQTPSFKYESEEGDNSSLTSGSGLGAHSSPHSNSQNASQQIVIPQAALDSLIQELADTREASRKLHETLQRVLEDMENFKASSQQETVVLRGSIDEDKFKMERMEEQMNDITELNQHEVTNLKQDITSMEEKIEYRLDERTSDIHDMLAICQTRIGKMELQQQQQQLISMEMVENVTFRTILTKLINVVLALLAVILVFVSTTANLLSPFLSTRARSLSTAILVVCLLVTWNNWQSICGMFYNWIEYIQYLLPNR